MLTNKQIDEILTQKPLRRYTYTVRTLLQEEELWGLFDGEGWLLLDVMDKEVTASAFVLFPHREFAEIFCHQVGCEGYTVAPLDLNEFLECLNDFEGQNIQVAVFPSSDFEATVVRAS